MPQTIILQSEEILVVEQDAPSGVITTEIETILLVEDTEVVVLEVAEQGPAGPAGLSGFAMRRVEYLALVDGVQAISLLSVPSVGLPINVFVNGLLHATASDYSSSSAILTLSLGVGVAAGDHITILYQ